MTLREKLDAYEKLMRLDKPIGILLLLWPVLWGLWLFSKVRSELPKAQEMADELLSLARHLQDPDLALQAHQALGMTAFCCGRPITAIPTSSAEACSRSCPGDDAGDSHPNSTMVSSRSPVPLPCSAEIS